QADQSHAAIRNYRRDRLAHPAMAPSEIDGSRRIAAEQSRHEQIREHAHENVGEKLAIAAVNFQQSGQDLPSIRAHRLTCEVEYDGCGKAVRTLAAEDSKNRPRVGIR